MRGKVPTLEKGGAKSSLEGVFHLPAAASLMLSAGGQGGGAATPAMALVACPAPNLQIPGSTHANNQSIKL